VSWYDSPVGEIVCTVSPLPGRAVPVFGCPLGTGAVLNHFEPSAV
jgi:hypothetical protein